ncbi:hypothetical protein PHYSODRAFT_300274 [Phytophthora sojae]|uniref:Uncharacterized protein n=1 Tax=Phytophthora sojae (strain P6497) TaxID=1094619 RepID=G4ZGL9_PHYSP|nr:hypothetical protein PHYSODRAFT_300274 [Phytophthora sojae]EGZ17101.1 hypothetical protein PHYSODRAFT_300274 [Phytophthora sojae]|eukprot:XP_009526159.1 hypothetical protein PHYSODRAFT_300274 [Phytophthora sojae]
MLKSIVRGIPVTSVIHVIVVKLVPTRTPKQDQMRETYDELVAGKQGEGGVSDPALAKVRRRKKPTDRVAKEKASQQGQMDNTQRGDLTREHSLTKGRRRKKQNKNGGENPASKQGQTEKQRDTVTVETKAATKAHGPESHGDIAVEMRTTCFRLVKVTTRGNASVIEAIRSSNTPTSAEARKIAIAMEL